VGGKKKRGGEGFRHGREEKRGEKQRLKVQGSVPLEGVNVTKEGEEGGEKEKRFGSQK